MEMITKKITIKKSMLNEISPFFADSFYGWCKRNKIKVEEPLNKKTERYETFVITLDTFDKHFLFTNKYMKSLKIPNS